MHNTAPRIIEAIADTARQIVGGLALTAAFMGSAAPASAGSARARLSAPYKEHLIPPGDLPGHDIGITEHAASLLAGASVLIEKTPNGTDGSVAPTAECSGVKVGIGEESFISVAAHCFAAETGVDNGVLNPLNFPPNDGALDFFDRSPYTYGIEASSTAPLDRQTLATATGITISTDSVDAALLRVNPSASTTSKSGQPLPGYQQVKALPYLRQADLTPGQKVAMYSTPESTDNEPVSATGTFIGVYQDPTGYIVKGVATTRAEDVVLIHPKQPYEDVCYYTASGSSFVAKETRNGSTAGLGGKIAVSGPLSLRINSLYDPYLAPTYHDTNPETQLKQSLIEEKTWRTEVELQLGVAISPKDTICKFSVVGNNTKSALVRDFGKNAPPLGPKGGGGPGTMR
jgi:hypothetical protein